MYSPVIGADVELFLKYKKSGNPAPSKKAIPVDGIAYEDETGHKGKIIRDGYQVEFNLYPATCRAFITNSIKKGFLALNEQCGGNVDIETKSMIEIPKRQMSILDEKAKLFGCDPSNNLHNKNATITVDPTVYRNRSAGGHIHIGEYADFDKKESTNIYYRYDDKKKKMYRDNIEPLVMMCDIFIGNTCVLLDRDPAQKERRKVYGRAGEYRIKPYGMEYRTPSNFWIMHGAIASFVLGLPKIATTIIYDKCNGGKIYDEVMNLVNINDVVDAINNNDFNKAKENFEKIYPIIIKLSNRDFENQSFGDERKNKYIKWLIITKCKSLFPDDFDVVKYWSGEAEGHYSGIDTYTRKQYNRIPDDINKQFEKYGE